LGVGCAIPAGIYAECKGKVRLIVQVIKDEEVFRIDEKLSRTNAVEEAREIAKNLKNAIGLSSG